MPHGTLNLVSLCDNGFGLHNSLLSCLGYISFTFHATGGDSAYSAERVIYATLRYGDLPTIISILKRAPQVVDPRIYSTQNRLPYFLQIAPNTAPYAVAQQVQQVELVHQAQPVQ
ncbi:hypothetical protein CDL15_Pgr016768 [Punica granatum]|uniref:Uncharacterized protein n=1 Tax=Punica granatum TaxID=22663 RepID=A0A218WYT0_PUNGR|nr:hypothetical protein CDL15_Pgr016768 [Punica granatum]